MSLAKKIETLCKKAREAAPVVAKLSTDTKNKVLLETAEALVARKAEIITENAKDLKAGAKKKLSAAMMDRLTLNEKRIVEMAKGLREVAALPDPLGRVVKTWGQPNGLVVQKVRI